VAYQAQPRRSKRYPVHWKAAVVFDHSAGRPILHTQTCDLSAGGGAIRTEYGDLTGSLVTLLLAQPPARAGEQPRMLKIPARVVSSVRTPGDAGYRHGLSFLRSAGDRLDGLEDLLKSVAPEDVPAVGRLAALKHAAQAKLAAESEAAKADPREERERRLSEAVHRAYLYFKELVEQLDVLKPAYPSKGYAVPGLPEFGEFAWDAGKLDLRTREISPLEKVFTRVILDFRLIGREPILKLTREYPACERLKQMLKDYGLEFSSYDTRNANGAIVTSTFSIAAKVVARVDVEGDGDAGKLILRMRNVERFGTMEYVVAPEAVTPASLEELAGCILGETGRVGPLLLQAA
jgi:hypothetical protein